MRTRIPLNLDQLAVTSFETQPTPQPEQPKEFVRTCLDTACPPYHCCA